MSRPRRNEEQATRQFSLYLTPTALDRLREAAAGARLSPGAYVERLIGFDTSVIKVNAPVPTSTPSLVHVWTDNATFGKVCSTCKRPRKLVDGEPCPGNSTKGEK